MTDSAGGGGLRNNKLLILYKSWIFCLHDLRWVFNMLHFKITLSHREYECANKVEQKLERDKLVTIVDRRVMYYVMRYEMKIKLNESPEKTQEPCKLKSAWWYQMAIFIFTHGASVVQR